MSEAAARWGYSQSRESMNTAGLLRKMETQDVEPGHGHGHGPASRISIDHYVQPVAKVRERYKSIIRQLPAKVFIDRLVDVYFKEFNWQYPVLDRELFMRQASEWNKVPFHVFQTTGPQELAPELRAFPALLFQVMATALLVIPDHPGGDFEALKYAASMTFDDLALDYSESGAEISLILGKAVVTFTTVQAGFMRAGFLKYTAQVIPSVCLHRGHVGSFIALTWTVACYSRDDWRCSGDWHAPRSDGSQTGQCRPARLFRKCVAHPTSEKGLHDLRVVVGTLAATQFHPHPIADMEN
jgi:hypothetical protein